jgi:hypothetical protein
MANSEWNRVGVPSLFATRYSPFASVPASASLHAGNDKEVIK